MKKKIEISAPFYISLDLLIKIKLRTVMEKYNHHFSVVSRIIPFRWCQTYIGKNKIPLSIEWLQIEIGKY